MARAATRSGWSAIRSPLSDGGEGLLDVSRRPGDRVETTEVTGPLGQPVAASWLRGGFHGWSPDGRWLAFVGQRNGKFELFRVAAAGGDEQRLTSKGAYDDGPEYSPDGKRV